MALISQWAYVVAAALFGALALSQFRRDTRSKGGLAFTMALAITAISALIAAFIPSSSGVDLASVATVQMRHLAWLGFLYLLWRQSDPGHQQMTLGLLYLVTAALFLGLGALPSAYSTGGVGGWPTESIMLANALLQIMAMVGGLVLVHNLYTAGSADERESLRLPLLAITAMWIYDLNLYTIAYLTREWPTELFDLQAIVLVLAGPLLALSIYRRKSQSLSLSRTAAFSSVSLIAIGGYLVAMFGVTAALELIGGEAGRLAQISFVFAASFVALLLGPSVKFRAWFRVKVSKHFFQHRYDYRSEWLRFANTLGQPAEQAGPLGVRVVKAIAEIVESPAGLLLIPDASGVLLVHAHWNWNLPMAQSLNASARLAKHVAQTGRVLELDYLRSEEAGEEASLLPEWMFAESSIWAVVPLVHFDRLAGVIVLVRPALSRTLDWEDFDLLRVAGRQVASYLAEARMQEELSDALRFDEFNRRFAFIMHDIKNLVSQLSLVTRNAERHADNPEFRADMIETLKSSTARMNALLARLSQHNKGKVQAPVHASLSGVAERIIATKRAQHPVVLSGDSSLHALFDPARLEQALGHLVQNAIEASPPAEPVTLRVTQQGEEVHIEVIDHGSGMSAAFIGTKLFKPFTSTKDGGFGIGTYEAQSDIVEMGGQIEVVSREGVGTTFTIRLPVGEELPIRHTNMRALAA